VVAGLVVVLVGLAGVILVIRVTGDDVSAGGWAIALTMMVAGIGSGTVISPNQTLTLARVPVELAGVAGSMLQLGQRVGSAMGIAVVLSTYYSLKAGGSTGAVAASTAMLITVALVAVSLVVAIVDLRARAHAAPQGKVTSAT